MVGAVLSGIITECLIVPVKLLSIKYTFCCFVLSVSGGFMPDIDSHSSKSKRIIFNFFAVSSLYLYYMYYHPKLTLRSLADIAGLYISIRYGLSSLLSKFTVHRGIFHSIPVMLIWAFISAILLNRILCLSSFDTWLVAATVSAGFFSHLLLDETYSVNLVGLKLKKSFGSALKLWGDNLIVNVIVYLAAIGLFVIMPTWSDFLGHAFSNLHRYQALAQKALGYFHGLNQYCVQWI